MLNTTKIKHKISDIQAIEPFGYTILLFLVFIAFEFVILLGFVGAISILFGKILFRITGILTFLFYAFYLISLFGFFRNLGTFPSLQEIARKFVGFVISTLFLVMGFAGFMF